MPPIAIRRVGGPLSGEDTHNLKLLIDGMSLIPVHNYKNPNIYDLVNYNGCSYAKRVFDYNAKNNKMYAVDADYFFPVVKEPIVEAFHLTRQQAEDLSFNQFYQYSDALVSEAFEGVQPKRYDFTSE